MLAAAIIVVIVFCYLGYQYPTRVPLLSAFASLSVVIMAIWGEQFRRSITGPKLELLSEGFRPDPTTWTGGKKTVFYHLKLINRRKWATARGVKVMLVKAEKLDRNKKFIEVLTFILHNWFGCQEKDRNIKELYQTTKF